MKFAWRNNLTDIAAWNSVEVEEVNLVEFEDLLVIDGDDALWDDQGIEMVVG